MLPSDNGAAIPSHKSPQIHTFPPKCHEWNFWIDGLTHSLGFPNYQYEVSKVEVHPFFAIRHQKQLALVFGEAEAGRSDVSNGRKGLCKKCCTFFVGKRLKLQKLWWYFNSWLQFYDFNSLLQSSKIVLKVGEPSTKMLLHSLWTAQIQSSLKGPYCCLQFIGSLGWCLKLYGPPFLHLVFNLGLHKFQSIPAPNPQTTMFVHVFLPSVAIRFARWPLAAGRHQQQAEDQGIQRHYQPDRVGTRKLHSCRIMFLLFWCHINWSSIVLNGGLVGCTREHKYTLCIYSLIIYIYVCV